MLGLTYDVTFGPGMKDGSDVEWIESYSNLGRASAGWRMIRILNRVVCDRHVAGFGLIVRSAYVTGG